LGPIFRQVLEMYPDKVKLVIKHFPLKMHKHARKSAQAALAASAQEKFWEFHHKLFENYKTINDKKIRDIAGELGLDMEKFEKDMNSSTVDNLIKRDLRNGIQIGVRGIPAVYINGKILRNRKLEGFSRAIEAELKKRK